MTLLQFTMGEYFTGRDFKYAGSWCDCALGQGGNLNIYDTYMILLVI